MTRIAIDSDSMDVEDWMPSKLNLSVPLMWDILQFNCITNPSEPHSTDLLDASLAPSSVPEDHSESSMLEIVVATSPAITIDTTDGGQEAPSLSRRAPVASTMTTETPRHMVWNETSFEPTDNLTFNTTPWLYADPSQFATLGDMGWHESQSSMTDPRNAPWWEGGTFSNAMFY